MALHRYSAASPAEGHDLLVLRALRYMAAAGVPEHERHVVLGVHLEDVNHPTPAPGTVRVLDILNPGRPAGELVTEFAVGDLLSRTFLHGVREVETQLGTFEPKSPRVK